MSGGPSGNFHKYHTFRHSRVESHANRRLLCLYIQLVLHPSNMSPNSSFVLTGNLGPVLSAFRMRQIDNSSDNLGLPGHKNPLGPSQIPYARPEG